MKIAISSTGKNIDDKIDETFGRCPYFIIAEVEDGKMGKIETIENKNINQTTGAGVSTAQLVAEKEVEAIITGNVGPRALDVLNQFNIKIYIGKGNIKEAINSFINNELEEIKK
jgi:predicted Fe-Mo cluster-binding NifX family protein